MPSGAQSPGISPKSGLTDTLERHHGGKKQAGAFWFFDCPECSRIATFDAGRRKWRCNAGSLGCGVAGDEADLIRRIGYTVTANGEHDAGDDAHGNGPIIITADALMRKTFPEPRWAVEGIFPEGLSLLVGAPKLGKSWLALNIAVAIASGGRAIGKIPVDAGDVLYLALEDTERRLQERLGIIQQGEPAPAGLHITTAWPTLANDGMAHLRAWLATHREARLVIIDTFQKLRGPIPGNQNAYASDYGAAGEIKTVADHYGVAHICLHHSRKADADDPLDTVSGTNGLAGAADTTLVLRREIGRHDATLYLRGRDVPEADHALNFDAVTCTWTLLGDAAEFRISEERKAIIDLLRDAGAPMSPKQIAEALGKKDGAVRFLLHKMAKAGEIDGVGGAYRVPLTPTNTANSANASGEILMESREPPFAGVSGENRTANAEEPRNHAENDLSVSSVSTFSGIERGIWVCDECHLPRSFDDRPCPSCGATTGEWLSRPKEVA